mmetsp:Transcript_16953/g.26107  ORF Transcript_16953/g.26107 Transcript_16953/m.26107 type:complete len:286 (-) Transcript_16953:254-1111(-)
MVALLVVAVHIHLVGNGLILLQVDELRGEVLLVQLQVHHANALGDLREVVENQVLLVTELLDLVHHLVDHDSSRLLVTEVGPHGALLKLLDHHVDEAVEHTGGLENLLVLLLELVGLSLLEGIDEIEGEVLVEGNIAVLILEHEFLHVIVLKCGQAVVVNVPVFGYSEATKVVGDSEGFFSSLQGQGLVVFVLFLLVSAEVSGGEHSLCHVIGENSVSADIIVRLVRQSVAVHRLHYVLVLADRQEQLGGSRLGFSRVDEFRDLGEVVLPLDPGSLDLSLFFLGK